MLIQLQLPIVDIRAFTEGEKGNALLPVPTFPTPVADEEFLRSAGMIRARFGGGLAGWIGENPFCDARRAIRFDMEAFKVSQLRAWKLQIAFRRFHFDGMAVGKFDIGFSTKRKFFPQLLEEFIQKLLSLRVRVASPGNKPVEIHLCEAGKPLAMLFSSARTKQHPNKEPSLDPMVISGTPALFIEVGQYQLRPQDLPVHAKEIALKHEDMSLFHWWVNSHGKNLHIWVLLRRRRRSAQIARNLRVYLLRLNAENQALIRVLKAVGSDQIKPEPRSVASDLLQDYLNTATSNIIELSAKSRQFATDDPKLLAFAAAAAEDFISDSDRAAILSHLNNLKIRKNIFRKIESQETVHDLRPLLSKQGPGDTIIYGPYIDNRRIQMLEPMLGSRNKNNPWVSGSFYLFVIIVLGAGLLAVGQFLPFVYLPIVVIGSVIGLSIVGAMQLKNDEVLKDKTFISLMALSFKYLPLLRSRESGGDRKSPPAKNDS